jgi:hypothetical protein
MIGASISTAAGWPGMFHPEGLPAREYLIMLCPSVQMGRGEQHVLPKPSVRLENLGG